MNHRIRPALKRTLAQVLGLLVPATGRRRAACAGPAVPAARWARTATGLRLVVRVANPPRRPAEHRPGADGRTVIGDRPTIDGAGPLVRPYLLAHEQEERQRERRNALALAVYGIDVGPWVIHGHTIGTRAMGMGVAV